MTVARYIERNPLRAKLVERAEQWKWGSLWRREHGSKDEKASLCNWPVPRPADWLAYVNEPQTDAELAAVRAAIEKNRPFGSDVWQRATARRLGLASCFRDRGRPRKPPAVADEGRSAALDS